ncbi:MAG TPA: hypothetical protein VFQ02_12490 [Nitrospira sp.]|nr:hypothetical protein [Nitrospira sp.]
MSRGQLPTGAAGPTDLSAARAGVFDTEFDRRDALCLAGLTGLLLLVYAQLWLPGLVLIKRDAFQLFLPLKQYIIDRLSAGELPQWFPYEGLGRPLIALTVMGVFHPFTALYWLLPVPDAYRLSTLLSCLMAASGTFLLARVLGISRMGATIGAVGFSCSGYVMSLTENLLYLYSLCALPLFVCSIEKLRVTRALRWIGASALIWASVILHGDIQTAYYYGGVAVIWTTMRGKQPGVFGRLIAVAALTVLVGAIQLAPSWVSYQHSDRTDPALFHAEAIHWSTHPLRLLTMLISPIGEGTQGDRVAEALFHTQEQGRGPAGVWAESLYLGLPLIGLGLAGLRRRGMLVFTVIVVSSIVLAMGSYAGVYDLFYDWVPLWSAFRYPEKLMGIATFGLALLSAGGVDVLRRSRPSVFLWYVTAALFAALAGVLATQQGPRLFSEVFLVPSDLAQHIAHAVSVSALCGGAVALGMGMLLRWMTIRPADQLASGAALVLLIVLDLAGANLPMVQTSSSEAWTFTPGFVSALSEDAKVRGPGHFRILSIKDSTAAVSQEVENRLTSRERTAALRRNGLYLEHNAVFGVESIQHYLAGLSPRVDEIGRNASVHLLARYNVAYFIGRPVRFESDSFAGSIVARLADYDLALVRNPVPVTPRAYLSRRPEVISPAMPMRALLERQEFLSAQVDGIEGVPVPLPSASAVANASILEYRPERVEVDVQTQGPAVLVLADAFEPGWKASIAGGGQLEMFRANGLVRAVLVPAGNNRIVFQYETPLLKVGAGISAVGLVLVALLFCVKVKKQGVSKSVGSVSELPPPVPQ